MPRRTRNRDGDDLRPEYDLSKLKGGVRGKYYEQAKAGTNLVLIEPDLAAIFPGEEAVNRALRLLATTANNAVAIRPKGRVPFITPARRSSRKRSAP